MAAGLCLPIGVSKDDPCTASNKRTLLIIGLRLCFKMEVMAICGTFHVEVKACSYRVVDQSTNDVKAIVLDGQDWLDKESPVHYHHLK